MKLLNPILMKKQYFFIFLILQLIFLSNISEAANLTDKQNNVAVLNAPEGVSYQWYREGQLLENKNLKQLEVTESGIYMVVVTMLDGTSVSSAYAVNVSAGSKVTVYVIGDSTACYYATSLYPRTGWGMVLQPFLNSDSVTVNNQAASGRSSKSYYDEGKWTTVYNLLKAGDFVLIQFAHNDEKTTDATRYTDPETTFKDYISIFIKGAIAKGATPVLISSIPRNNWSGTTVQQAHKPYTQAMIQLADSFQIPFIDMEAATMAYLNTKGKTYATDSIYNNLAAGVWPNYLTGNSDGTHLQENGAYQFCKVVTDEFKKYTGNAAFERLAKNIISAARISAMPSPDLKGTITGYGVYPVNSKITLTAAPVSGYRFVKWATTSDTTAISRNTSITINLDSADVNLLAYFESLTAVENTFEANSVKIFPNPVTDILNINAAAENWSINVFDITGRKIYSDSNVTQISLKNLPQGTYILNVLSNGQVFKQPLLKL